MLDVSTTWLQQKKKAKRRFMSKVTSFNQIVCQLCLSLTCGIIQISRKCPFLRRFELAWPAEALVRDLCYRRRDRCAGILDRLSREERGRRSAFHTVARRLPRSTETSIVSTLFQPQSLGYYNRSAFLTSPQGHPSNRTA